MFSSRIASVSKLHPVFAKQQRNTTGATTVKHQKRGFSGMLMCAVLWMLNVPTPPAARGGKGREADTVRTVRTVQYTLYTRICRVCGGCVWCRQAYVRYLPTYKSSLSEMNAHKTTSWGGFKRVFDNETTGSKVDLHRIDAICTPNDDVLVSLARPCFHRNKRRRQSGYQSNLNTYQLASYLWI